MLNFGAVIEQLPSRPKTTKRCVTIKGPNLCTHASHRFENKKDNITMTTKSSQTFLCNHCAFFRFLSNYGHINLLWVSTIPLFFKTNLQLWAFWPFKNAANIPCRQTGAKHRHTTLLIARCQQLQGVLERGMTPGVLNSWQGSIQFTYLPMNWLMFMVYILVYNKYTIHGYYGQYTGCNQLKNIMAKSYH